MQDSAFSRITGALLSPSATFSSIAQRPTWLVALLVLVLLGTVVGWVSVQRVDFVEETRQQMESRGQQQVSDEQLEKIAGFQKIMGGVVGPLVFGSGFYFLAALLFWVAFKMVGGEFDYRTGLATTLHAYLPQGVKSVLLVPILLGRGELSVEELQTGSVLKSNLGAFAPEETGLVAKALLSSVDLFSIWTIVLLVIGFAAAAKSSRKTAGITVGVVWLLGVAVKVGLAVLGQGFGG